MRRGPVTSRCALGQNTPPAFTQIPCPLFQALLPLLCARLPPVCPVRLSLSHVPPPRGLLALALTLTLIMCGRSQKKGSLNASCDVETLSRFLEEKSASFGFD